LKDDITCINYHKTEQESRKGNIMGYTSAGQTNYRYRCYYCGLRLKDSDVIFAGNRKVCIRHVSQANRDQGYADTPQGEDNDATTAEQEDSKGK